MKKKTHSLITVRIYHWPSGTFLLFLSIVRPSCGFWGILNRMEHLYVSFVHIIYTGQRCHSFYDCVTFFIVYPRMDGAPLTLRFTGL